ncbi:glycoside hydrolase family 43 protein [Spirosoma arcticum]
MLKTGSVTGPVFYRTNNVMNKNRLLLPLLLVVLMGGPMACRKTPTSGTTVTPTPTPVSDTATTFRNPLLPAGPDPWVIYQDGFYYVMHTTGGNVRIYKTKKMSLLSSSQYSGVWSPPSSGPATRDIWAPELHRVNNRWYIYYAAVVAPNTQHRMYVLENEAADPLTGTWVLKGELKLADDKWAIDGTLLQQNGQLYFAWSGWENAVDNRKQNVYICKMKDPVTADGPRVLVSAPDYDWEKQGNPDVNEGPEFLTHDGKVFLVYSASHCSTDDYALGILTASATADLTNPASWTKSATPVFGPTAANGTYGVGHNSFFTTPDSRENWILYHANPQAGQGCDDRRSIRMQRFTWKADGSPDFGKPASLTELQKRPSGE